MNDVYESFKEQVRAQADIVKVVSEYVALKKKGGRYWGCCPFHGEKTPSFTVTPGKNLFHCFGCHVGGDVFNFVMKIENLSFPEATKFLANKYGIPIPEKQKTEQEILREKKSKQIYDANALAARFFQACLLKTEYGKSALEYLFKRGIDMEIIEKFSLGLAAPGYHTLCNALKKRGLSDELLAKAGLVVKRDEASVYDRFRERIMIPIKDARGRVVGFTGRVFGKGEPKYLNTGETELFTKRSILFGMDVAFKAAKEKKQIIVVEGHMDAISLHAAGINWAVASMGTAFTEQHANLISHVVPEVVFSFDSDEAGLKAAMDAIPVALRAGLEVRVLVVPMGKDPDEFIRLEGTEAFVSLIAQASSGVDFQIERTLEKNNFSTLEGKVKTVSNILPFLLECKSDIEVVRRIRNLAQKLTIDENLIVSEFKKIRRGKGISITDDLMRRKKENNKAEPVEQAERHLLFALINGGGAVASDFLAEIDKIGFCDVKKTEIYQKFKDLSARKSPNVVADLFAELPEAAVSELEVILHLDLSVEAVSQILNDCIRQLKISELEKRYEHHCRLAAEYERAGDEKFLQELAESQRIKNEIKKMF